MGSQGDGFAGRWESVTLVFFVTRHLVRQASWVKPVLLANISTPAAPSILGQARTAGKCIFACSAKHPGSSLYCWQMYGRLLSQHAWLTGPCPGAVIFGDGVQAVRQNELLLGPAACMQCPQTPNAACSHSLVPHAACSGWPSVGTAPLCVEPPLGLHI